MLNRHQLFGYRCEDLAAERLEGAGYVIVARNYRTPFGEIDLIAREGGAIVFVEVKARKTKGYGHPKLAVDRRKQLKLSKSALAYLKQTGQSGAKARFDVVTVTGGAKSGLHIEVVRNAFNLAFG